jgi:conjugative transfer signal peptidase TraF
MTRRSVFLLSVFAIALLLLSEGDPTFVWNVSESVPTGLYRLTPARQLSVTEFVALRPPEPLETFLDLNGYLPIGVPMLKRILAVPGQTVCRSGVKVTVDGIELGVARERDGSGRPLPVWQGCRVVGNDEIFVMNWQSPNSLDGRYFGLIPASAVIGQAIPVWTEGD